MSGGAPRGVRLVVLVCLAIVPASAAPALAAPTPVEASTGGSGEAAARRLLERAADASRSVGYAGTQYVAGWSASASTSALVEVAHDPAQGTVVTQPSSAGPPYDAADLVAPDGGPALEGRVLDVLARHYALRVAGSGSCAGRSADLVEARRPGTRGDGAVAGRFWLDRESGLVLRREVYDAGGRTISSSAFLDLEVTPATPGEPLRAAQPGEGSGDGGGPGGAVLQQMRSAGWQVPEALPGGFSLFDARLRDDDRRVQLSYTDGLSTLSLFAQRGEIGEGPGGAFRRSSLDGARVWTSSSVPQRVVWSGGGQVWTLVSDAPVAAVHDAVVALPHDPPPDDGLLARLERGLRRMGGMLNPFG